MAMTFFVSPVKFSYWSKFRVNISTGSGIMTIFSYKGLTGNPEIGNTLFCVFSNIRRLGRGRDTKFGTNVPEEILLNAAKCHGDSLQVTLISEWFRKYPPLPRLGLVFLIVFLFIENAKNMQNFSFKLSPKILIPKNEWYILPFWNDWFVILKSENLS